MSNDEWKKCSFMIDNFQFLCSPFSFIWFSYWYIYLQWICGYYRILWFIYHGNCYAHIMSLNNVLKKKQLHFQISHKLKIQTMHVLCQHMWKKCSFRIDNFQFLCSPFSFYDFHIDTFIYNGSAAIIGYCGLFTTSECAL
jgi:hypothetical protein